MVIAASASISTHHELWRALIHASGGLVRESDAATLAASLMPTPLNTSNETQQSSALREVVGMRAAAVGASVTKLFELVDLSAPAHTWQERMLEVVPRDSGSSARVAVDNSVAIADCIGRCLDSVVTESTPHPADDILHSWIP